MTHLGNEIPRNNPKLDSLMFLQHNASQSQEPPNLAFEPSPVWHDDDQMVTDESAKVFLRNTLMKSKSQVKELKLEAEKQQREVEGAKRIRDNVRQGKDKRDEVDVVRAIFNLQEKLHETERKRVTAEVETLTILAVVGDLSLGAKNHNFRSQTFKIPTNCDLCGERIWGLSAKGFDCVDCGYTCHSKCQMKVPAECPGEQTKEEKKKLKADRQAQSAPGVSESAPSNGHNGAVAEMPALTRRDTMNSLSSGYAHSAHRSVSGSISSSKPSGEEPADLSAAPPRSSTSATKRNRVLAPPPTQYASSPTAAEAPMSKKSEQRGKMVYAYQATGDGEVNVNEGQEIVVLEPDGKWPFPVYRNQLLSNTTVDGSGWMRVKAGSQEGLVPSAYAELAPAPSPALTERPASTYSNSSASLAGSTTAKRIGPAVAPRRGAKKLQYVEALYDYEARSDAEHSMSEGDRFVLVSKDGGDGWAEVEKGGQVKSVPANYVQEV